MGRSPCCDEAGLKKGPWTPEEDKLLGDYIRKHGHGSWRHLPKLAGLNRCGKSCRLRWTNYLRPDIKRGKFDEEEERLIIHLHSVLGNKWSAIASNLPGRTDNEIKNYWNTHLRKKLLSMGIDPVTHRPRTDLNLLAGLPSFLASTIDLNRAASYWDSLRLQTDAAQVARFQLLQGIIQQLLMASSPPPSMDPMMSGLLGSNSLLQNTQLNDLIKLKHQLEGLNGSSLLALSNIHHRDFASDVGMIQQANNFQVLMDSMATAPMTAAACSTEHAMQDNENNNNNNTICGSANLQQESSCYNINVRASSSIPTSFVSTSPENSNAAMDLVREPNNNSSDVTINSPTSTPTPFEAWERLKAADDLDGDICWEDILEEISWPNTSISRHGTD